ncbi:hypothetical protein ACIGEP_06155 [Microbacterium sp. NPDC077663]|uniref:hypothetical protein n=1 Tax=Microbacterium sp. NPDC077663 TaxID=3364189 RepID=UPI0037CB39E0
MSWDESWALPAIEWLLTPALVTAGLLALARLYDAPTRWARRLKSDIAILAGLPDGSERRAWQASIERQAMRLREYRRAFTGWTLFWKWSVVAAMAATLFGLILYPPINRPGQPEIWGPGDWVLLLPGLYACVTYVVTISAGLDFLGRSPRDILLRRRLRAHNRRDRRLRRIEKVRAKRANTDPTIRARGSRLGFRTQVDEFGPWMRDFDMRGYVRTAGLHAADQRAHYAARLNERGVRPPLWPDPDTKRAPTPHPEEPDPATERSHDIRNLLRRLFRT